MRLYELTPAELLELRDKHRQNGNEWGALLCEEALRDHAAIAESFKSNASPQDSAT
jgi:hypothetical protein